jgi:hypothetical protein
LAGGGVSHSSRGRLVSAPVAAAARLLPMLPASAAPDVTRPLAEAIMRLLRLCVTTEPVCLAEGWHEQDPKACLRSICQTRAASYHGRGASQYSCRLASNNTDQLPLPPPSPWSNNMKEFMLIPPPPTPHPPTPTPPLRRNEEEEEEGVTRVAQAATLQRNPAEVGNKGTLCRA